MTRLIRSGSHTPGISADDFGLPPGTAIRYERPDSGLAALLPGYAVLDSDDAIWRAKPTWMLPSWAQIWFVLTEGAITVSIGKRRYDPLASTILYGVTSRAMPVVAHGGVTVMVEVSPLGWARLIRPSAETLRDRITPLSEVMPAEQVREIATALHGSDRDLAVKGLLDEAFLRHLPPPNPVAPMVAAIMELLADEEARDLPSAARALGISSPTLLRLSKRYFGFTPKLLMMRARFLRAVRLMLTSPEQVDAGWIPPGYHNVPHLLRDADRFLGMTPRRFVAMDMPYLLAAIRARALVLEGPVIATGGAPA